MQTHALNGAAAPEQNPLAGDPNGTKRTIAADLLGSTANIAGLTEPKPQVDLLSIPPFLKRELGSAKPNNSEPGEDANDTANAAADGTAEPTGDTANVADDANKTPSDDTAEAVDDNANVEPTAVNVATGAIDFDKAVLEGKAILAKVDAAARGYLRLGELAAGLEKQFKTLNKFASRLGVSACTLRRYREVWERWDGSGKRAPERVSYAVLKELATHEDREAIVNDNPDLKKSGALAVMRKYRKEQAEKQGKDRNYWLRDTSVGSIN